MTRPARLTLLIGAAALAGVAGLGYIRLTTPEPAVTTAIDCTTCDARQASKKRLRDYLQSLPEE